MNKGLKDAKKTINIIKKREICFGTEFDTYSPIYQFTNENLSALCETFDFKNKNVLSVASSGDQYFSFLLNGASKVDLFDINLLTKYYIILKQIFILSSSLEDFINFFQNIGKHYNFFRSRLIKRQYEKINKRLPKDVKIFWDYIINNLERGEIPYMFQSTCFNDGSSPYLLKNEYQKLKQILENRDLPNFKGADIYSLFEEFNDQYDIIYLSNIHQYKDSEEYFSFIREKLIKLLNDNGQIISGYSWQYEDYQLEHINNGFEEVDIVPYYSLEHVYVYKKGGNYGK